MSDVLPTHGGDRPEPTRPAGAVPRPSGPQEPTRVEGAVLDPTEAFPAQDPWAMPVEVLPGAPVPPQDRLRGRRASGLVAAGVAVVLTGGAAMAWAAFNGNIGDQPEMHLPASTGAMIKVDLDPSAGQKIDAVRFLGKLPVGKDLRDGRDPSSSSTSASSRPHPPRRPGARSRTGSATASPSAPSPATAVAPTP
jgi:hypothetical protein